MKILSISDVITNSSSEVFCYITGDKLDEIYDIFETIIGYNQEYELTPVIKYGENDYGDECIIIDLPYSYDKIKEYIRDAIEGLLDYPEFDNCEVEFNMKISK